MPQPENKIKAALSDARTRIEDARHSLNQVDDELSDIEAIAEEMADEMERLREQVEG